MYITKILKFKIEEKEEKKKSKTVILFCILSSLSLFAYVHIAIIIMCI